jgi:hypothetical protein
MSRIACSPSNAYEHSAAAFEWKFTRHDLTPLVKKRATKPDHPAAA